MDALAPPAVEPIERDPVAGCVERRRQLPSQGDLLLLDGPPIRGEVLYRGGRIQEDENAQIAACLLQGTIDVRGARFAGLDVAPQPDEFARHYLVASRPVRVRIELHSPSHQLSAHSARRLLGPTPA